MAALLFLNATVFLLLTIMMNVGSSVGLALRFVFILMTIINFFAGLGAAGLMIAAPEGMRWF